MRYSVFSIVLMISSFFSISMAAENVVETETETVEVMADKAVNEKREKVDESAQQILNTLYTKYPSTRAQIEDAAGYAVFSNFGLKILVAGGGKGTGVVVDNASQQRTYMKMLELQAGLGFGIKRFQVIFVFENNAVMNEFINSGWEFGGQATAAAKLDDEGMNIEHAISVSPGIWMYQLTKDGLALEITGKGTKFYIDEELN